MEKEKKTTEKFEVFDQRPWGTSTVLDEGEGLPVKRLEVSPEKRLSDQKRARRAEHRFVVRGIAKVTLNGAEILVKTGERRDIAIAALAAKTRKRTPGFIEIQY